MNPSCTPYRDRTEAGRILARALKAYAGRSDTVVLALPRGGVPVAFEVARALHAPLDVFVVRKLGVPSQPELAMGAVASGGSHVLNQDVIRHAGVGAAELQATLARETAELHRREARYRDERPPLPVQGRVALVIDDGLATGASLRAALQALAAQSPARLVVGVPVGAPESIETLRPFADEIVCPLRPEAFHAVGVWYDHFPQTSDDEVRQLLEEAAELSPAGTHPPDA